jgi:NADPH-dependent curcumin reductase CurA
VTEYQRFKNNPIFLLFFSVSPWLCGEAFDFALAAYNNRRTGPILVARLIPENGAIMPVINHQFRLAARPEGLPKRTDWNFTEEPVRDPGPGEVLIQILYISLDPAMRGWMNDTRSYIEPVKIGAVMRAGTVGRVMASQNPGFAAGDFVTGALGVQEYAVSDGKGITKIDPRLAPPAVWLSVLGLTGLTAYFGLLEVGQIKEGDTVVISGAAGATGIAAGQIAKI